MKQITSFGNPFAQRLRCSFLLLSLFFIALSASAQRVEKGTKVAWQGGKYEVFRLELRDKAGTKYSLKKPEKYLSQRALDRRQRQGIAVNETDLPVSERYLKEIRKRGFEIIGGSRWLNTVLVKVERESDAVQLDELPFVNRITRVFITPDSVAETFVYPLLTDTLKPDTTVYGQGLRQMELLNVIPLHQAGYRGQGIRIAVLDGGFMNVDKIPTINSNVLEARDMTYPFTTNVYRLLEHGTQVLSCMSAKDEGRLVGGAPDAEYVLLRTEIGPTEQLIEEDWWVMAAEYADSIGCDMLNSSLGYVHFTHHEMDHRYRDLDGKHSVAARAASMLASKGIILCNSAGNSGNNVWKKIGTPADASDILAVGAIDAKGVNTKFSSVGPSQDGRVKPDVMAMGGNTAVIGGRGILKRNNGTSFSSPVLCGAVAALWSALPNKTAYEIMDLVRHSAHQYDYPDNIFGYGIPNIWNAYLSGK